MTPSPPCSVGFRLHRGPRWRSPNNASLAFCWVLPDARPVNTLACVRVESAMAKIRALQVGRAGAPLELVEREIPEPARARSVSVSASDRLVLANSGELLLRDCRSAGLSTQHISAEKSALCARLINGHGSHALFRTAHARADQRSKPAPGPGCRPGG